MRCTRISLTTWLRSRTIPLPAITAAIVLLLLVAIASDGSPAEGGASLALTQRADDARPVDRSSGEHAIDAFTKGEPPVRWADSTIPVDICTHHANRPAAISADHFRAAVLSGTEMWNRAGAAVGLRYAGDCDSAQPWDHRNGLSEVAFDSAEAEVDSPNAAVSRGRWTTIEDARYFAEVDIIIDRDEVVSDTCFRSVIAHELGHVLGFGHSDDPSHLMDRSFTPSDPSTCVLEVSAEERRWLADLYGNNVAPSIDSPEVTRVAPGATARVAVPADSSHQELLYRWTQTAGADVAFATADASITFVVPEEPGAEFRFRLEVFDPYLATATADVSVVVTDEVPTSRPREGFDSWFDPAPSEAGLTLTHWQGGGYEALASAIGPDGSAWITSRGAFLGFHGGAPAFVNARFVEAMPGGPPTGALLLVVRQPSLGRPMGGGSRLRRS